MTGTLATGLRAGRWQHVATLSSAAFTVRNLGVRHVRGTVPIREATVEVGPGGAPGAVRAVLELTGIDTGNRRRDTDLQKPHLLATAQQPLLTFTAGAVQRSDAGLRLAGRLSGRQTIELTLDVDEVRPEPDGRMLVRASGSFDRRRLGIRAPRLLIGRRVAVTVEAVFTPPS